MYSNSFLTDTDWGCTIRSGQMLFCNLLIFKMDFAINRENDSNPFFQLFIENGNFSIAKFLKEADEKQMNLRPGNWWTPSQFTSVLESLSKKNTIKKEDENKILKNYLSLSADRNCSLGIIEFTSIIRFKDIYKLFEEFDFVCCFVHCILDKEHININSKSFLFEMMMIEEFSGFLGSEGNKSYYIFGHDGRNLLYLDPHSITESLKIGKQQVFLQGANQILFKNLNSFLTLGFLINKKMIERFEAEMNNLSKKYDFLTIFGKDVDESNSLTPLKIYDFNETAKNELIQNNIECGKMCKNLKDLKDVHEETVFHDFPADKINTIEKTPSKKEIVNSFLVLNTVVNQNVEDKKGNKLINIESLLQKDRKSEMTKNNNQSDKFKKKK